MGRNPFLLILFVGVSARAAMPVAQENALIGKYCAVCHTDVAKNGGLSLQHFDAAVVSPSLAAMLLSKLSGEALGAAGLPIPDKDTETGLRQAITAQAVGATRWTVETVAGVTIASVLRESQVTSANPPIYRLAVECNVATREGVMQLSWSPNPRTGTLAASWDDAPASLYPVEGTEKMGNGSAVTTGPAAITLPASRHLPARTLAFSGLFPGEPVVFPFRELPEAARRSLNSCFVKD